MATESFLPDDSANVILSRLRREWVRVGFIVGYLPSRVGRIKERSDAAPARDD